MKADVRKVDANGLPCVIDQIMSIENSSFSVPWNENDFVSSAVQGVLAAAFNEGKQLVGYGCLISAADEAEITNLAVGADSRRCGIGGAILDFLIRSAVSGGTDKIYLEVRESNTCALALYSSRRFIRVGKRRGYYRLPKEDAVLMALEIKSEKG